jgi:hypothetical protein
MKRNTQNTEWRKVVGNDNYLVSNTGLIKELTTDRMLVKKPHGGCRVHGKYEGVTLIDSDGEKVKYYVHRLMAEAFLPKPSPKHTDVRHINGVKTDNRLENIEWVTRSENMLKANENMQVSRRRVVTDLPTVFAIRYESEVYGVPASTLAKQYGRSTTSVKKIIRYETFNSDEIITEQCMVLTSMLEKDMTL